MAIWHGQFPTGFTNVVSGPKHDGFRVPPMPDDGWITAILIAYDSWDSGDQSGRWGIHGDQGQALYTTALETFPHTGGQIGGPTRRAVSRQHTMTTPLRVTIGQQVYPGISHNEQMGFVCDINNMTPNAGNNWYELDWDIVAAGVPSDIIPGNRSFLPVAQANVLFEAQQIPVRPAWVSPTPVNNGTTTDPSPLIKFSMPKNDWPDSSTTVDIELTVLNTGAFWHWIRAVSSAQNSVQQFDWQLPEFAPGDQLSVRARHQDTWGDWSEWSDTRVFSIFDAPPGQGVWQSPTPAENALVTTSTPAVRGSTPHPGGDAAYDQSNGVQLQVVNAVTNVILQDAIFGPTPTDMAADIFNYTIPAIAQNTNAKIRFRHHDRKGTWSEWSAYRTFTISAGPDIPTISRPKGKCNFRNETEYQAQGGVGSLYAGSYNNISGTAMHSVRIQLWNADATAMLNDSGWVARTATAGVWTLPQANFPGHPSALAWATTYKIRANVAETNAGVRGIESGWGEFVEMRTNSFPDRPTALSPADGIPTSTLQFSATVQDPDGDAITAAEMTIKRVDNNALVTTQSMVVSGNTLTKTLSSPALTLGVEYQWYCRASDQTGYGTYSFVEPFVYASRPNVTNVAPRATERYNLIRDPSAEYIGATQETSPFWSTLNATVDSRIERSGDDSIYGDMSWKGTTTATNTLTFRSEKIFVDGTKPYLLQGEFKKLSGTSATRFRVRCYTSADVFISSLTPSSILSASATNVPTTWTRYGGIIWQIGSGNTPAFPATTAKVEIEILPSENSIAQVFFDGISFEQLMATGFSSAQWLEAQKWFGYFDGDTPNHNSTAASYYWIGESGISSSRGDARVTSPAAKVYFLFTHTQNMQDRRLLIDRFSDTQNAWVQIYDSGFVAQSATSGTFVPMDLPPAIIKNDDRYRFRIQARDSLGISGEGAGTIADTDYIGQPEPAITSISSDVSKAEVVLNWSASTLSLGAFAGYEIARMERDGPSGTYTVLYREMNKEVTRFTDPYPLSNVDYIYMVRIVELVGVDERQGRWGKASMNCNYFPFSFIKAADDPQNLYVAYETPLDAMPTPEEDAIQQVVMPWGRSRPTVLTRADMRLRSASVVANFYNDAQYVEDALTRYNQLKTILTQRKTICILTQEPDKERIFASVMGAWQRIFRGPDMRGITFDFQENGYLEDLRDREERY